MKPSSCDIDVVVVGAGLSGLSCAFDLARAGCAVVVLEAKPYLGGRTSSWVEDGMPVESGFHRFRGIYRALPALLRRAGLQLADLVDWQTTVELRAAHHAPEVFGVAPVHDPLTTLRGVLRNSALLSTWDKLSMVPRVASGAVAHAFFPKTLDRRSVTEHVGSVPARALQRIVVPLTRGVFFRAPEGYSAYAFMMPLAYSLRRFWRMRSGVFRGGMSEVMANPLGRAIERQGAQVRTAAAVQQLRWDGKQVSGVELDRETLRTRHVVVATALGSAKQLLNPLAHDAGVASVLRLPTTPSVTVHMDLQRPALQSDHPVFAPGTSLMCFAEQSRTTFRHTKGRLSIVLSPSEQFIDMPEDRIVERVLRDAQTVQLPLADTLRRYRVVRMPHDFCDASPGTQQLRPSQQTSIRGLTLAGDYTRQPFLSTMEGAVLAGQQAARDVLAADRL